MIIFLLFAAAELGAPLSAPMSRVTVYADRAEITRKAEVPCDAGTAEATLPPIPGHAEASSIRVELAGVAQLTSLTSEVLTRNVAVDPRKAALDKEREVVRARLDVIRDTLKALDEREAFLEKLAQFFAAATNEELRAPKPPWISGRRHSTP